jgi:hypothetical protein
LGSEFSERNSGESLQKANPNKTEITQEDKLWAATMLEMDLKVRTEDFGNRGRESIDRAQPENVEENEDRKHSLGGIISGRIVSDRIERRVDDSKNIEELNSLISKYKGQKLTNEQVAEVVSAACFVSNNRKITLHPNVEITDDVKKFAINTKVVELQRKGVEF